MSLPDKFSTIRPHQTRAVADILAAFEAGADVVFLDAPVGAGKTCIAEMVRQALDVRGLYVCSDKQLQRQFMDDFGAYAKVLQGRNNYPTENSPATRNRFGQLEISAEDCTATTPGGSDCWHCSGHHTCPYQIAKSDASMSELAVLNTSYLLAEASSPASVFGGRAKRDLVVIDEADMLEDALMNFVQFEVPQWAMRKLGLVIPKKGVHKPTLAGWLRETADATLRAHFQEQKERRRARMFALECRRVADELEKDTDADEDAGAWLRDYDTKTMLLKPVLVGPYGTRALWRNGRKFLLMSGTIISSDEMAASLGLPLDYETVTVPMTFPVENRPIVMAPVANVVNGSTEDDYLDLVYAVEQIAVRHTGERVLVHTVSKFLAEKLASQCNLPGRNVCSYTSANGRRDALREYMSDCNSILFAQSMDRGVDLPDDACRVVVIAKVPFPSFGDRRVGARVRLPGGQAWYAVQTIRKIVQMTGRGVRHHEDHAHCVAPETKVLTRDLRWVHADSLKQGDEIWGFDEQTTRLKPRQWRPAVVEATGIESLERVKINLADGTSITVTPDHRLISKWGQSRDDSWLRADQLRPGHHLNRYVEPWGIVDSRGAGYVSGMFDGEGCLSVGLGKRNRNVIQLTLAQKAGLVMEETKRLLSLYGFNYGETTQRSNDVSYLALRGGLSEQLRLMGEFRPLRLLHKFVTSNFAARMESRHHVEITSIEQLEPGPMVTLQSSTGTYFTDGFASHNTYILDKQFAVNVYAKSRHLIPRYWLEGLDASQDVRWLMRKYAGRTVGAA